MSLNVEIPDDMAHRLGEALRTQIEFGSYLKLIRLANGMSRLELAAKAGLSRSHLSLLERGLRYPSPKTLKKLLKEFELIGAHREKFLLLAAKAQVDIEVQEQTVARVRTELPPLSEEELEVFGPLVERMRAQGLHQADS